MSYQADLLNVKWQKLRAFKLQSVGWKCERCGARDRTFHVHHPKYRQGAAPWEYWITELEALCDRCHAEQHGKRDTDVLVATCYQAMAESHRRGDWDEQQRFAEDGMRLLEEGFYYQGLV